MSFWDEIDQAIRDASGEQLTITDRRTVGGGSINETWHLHGDTGSWFIKLNTTARLDMFEAEVRGLEEMHRTQTIRVPQPLVTGTTGDIAYLVLEYIQLGSNMDRLLLGEQLAALHRTSRLNFGWDINNTIGSTAQINTSSNNWIDFFAEHRLGYQLKLAQSNDHLGKVQELGERVLESFPSLFDTYTPVPSLLHGDLWNGNCAGDPDGQPVLFDPAMYYGDREADLAMTELFGGFGSEFFEAYHAQWPVDPGYPQRKTLYNLYHILNHLNLFGGHYRMQAERMMESLLSELK
ncbi:MAG TPA: fructosamine kinase family protein [Gammaproteobacteria bacterium]|nr:fructosamine kinase family protein [Gammaproteobacteria bacterium]